MGRVYIYVTTHRASPATHHHHEGDTMKATRQTQTTRMNGAKVRIVTTTSATGTKVTVKAAPVEEWLLQHEQIRHLRNMPEYGKSFLLVGGMEAGKRSKREQVKAKATGLTAGHPDVTIFLPGGKCGFIENKAENGRLSPEQIKRHADLRSIGHIVEVVKASTPAEAADAAVTMVRGWLSEIATKAA